MHIREFINNFTNHPVLFIGTGMSLRYLETSFTWNELLSHIAFKVKNTEEYYYDVKSKHVDGNGDFNYENIAEEIEKDFNEKLTEDRYGELQEINDIFYENMKNGDPISRFKIYISKLLEESTQREEKQQEIAELKKIRKNIGSIVTTNYDRFIEEIFEFNPLIGNDILLSNPYGSVYKIHGCLQYPDKIIITKEDYEMFNKRYELIRAQLLSLFIHNPIIFFGYNIGDKNIKNILSTIFTYIHPNTEEANKIKSNFLLIEYEKDSTNTFVTDHDIDIDGFSTIRINKLKTDNFLEIYKHLSNLNLPVSAMDVRKVQNIAKEIYAGGNIKVNITEDIESLKNDEKVLAIGSQKTIKYDFQTIPELMENYFNIIDEANHQLLKLIDKQRVQSNQYFPVFGFDKIQPSLTTSRKLMEQQKEKITGILNKEKIDIGKEHNDIDSILEDRNISNSKKTTAVFLGVFKDRINLSSMRNFLKNYSNKRETDYKKLLCVYDYKQFANEEEKIHL